jgi:hypothetical protein
MRRWLGRVVACSASLLALGLPGAAPADGLQNLKAGTTSVIEAPADVVWHVISPPDDFVEELPAGQVTGRMVGVFSGPLLAIYRLGMGVTDLLFAPIWVFPVMSPEPRWELFEGVEYQ